MLTLEEVRLDCSFGTEAAASWYLCFLQDDYTRCVRLSEADVRFRSCDAASAERQRI